MPPGATLEILVVDDDAPLREMLTRAFERRGHTITAGRRWVSALEILEHGDVPT